MNYLVAVLPDRIQAEAAYLALEKEGIPTDKVSILGRGYKSADEYGLIDPIQQARQRMKLMAFWLLPFGFIAGFSFSLLSGLDTFAWAGEIGNHIIGGLLGSVAAGMGSFVAGGGVDLGFGSGDALPYRDRLSAGKYLVVVKGSNNLTNQATPILRQFAPEKLQSYVDPNSATF